MRRRALTITAVLLTVAAAACSGDGITTTTSQRQATPTIPGSDDMPALPADPDAAFVVLDGGVPAITADGRVFQRVAEAQGFAAAPPKPAIGALTVSRLTPAGLAEVVATADELGLLTEPPDYGDVGVTDQASVSVTLSTAEGTFVHSVYAPGYETGDADADAARERLAEFVRYVGALPTELGDEIGTPEPYVPDEWLVDTSPYVSASSAAAWPFAGEPVAGCATFPVSGSSDTVSGIYTSTGDDGDRVVQVSPALPFDDC